MKILLLQDSDWKKKGPHQQHHLMELMSLRGHEILVIGFDQLWREDNYSFFSKKINEDVNRFYPGASVHYIRPLFIKIPFLDYFSFFLISYFEIRNQIRKFNPDVVIGFSSVISNYWGAIFSEKYHIPYIYYWYDIVHVLNIPKPFGPLAKFIEKLILKKSTQIFTINHGLIDSLVELGADRRLIKVIPGGIDFERFNHINVNSLAIREKFGILKNDFVLFFMGWVYEFSGLKEVITSIIQKRDICPNLKLLIVGYGDYYSELEKIVVNNKIENQVILAGKRPYEEIPQLIGAVDICLLPAHNNEIMKDIVPIKMYEYLAMNKPVIATKMNGIYKEFGDNNGVLYIKNSEDVIEKVNCLTNEEIINAKRFAETFIKEYSWEKIISRFEYELNNY